MEYKVISTKVHGILDYVMGAGLIAFGAMLGGMYKNKKTGKSTLNKAASLLPIGLGAATIGMSLLTDYELSAKRLIPMKGHLAADAINGATLAAAPLLFGFAKKTWLGHVVLGVTELLAVLMTKTTTSTESRALISDFVLHNKWFGKPVHPAKIKPRALEVA